MSLFNTLLRLQLNTYGTPVEDWLTEMFKYALENEEDFLLNILHLIDPRIDRIPEDLSLRTQATFKKIRGHREESRPDMVLSFKDYYIFIENKVDSPENVRGKQLNRYAQHLNESSTKNKILVYITRDYDPKNDENEFIENDKPDPSYIFAGCKENTIEFVSLRWHQIFRELKKYKSNPIIQETLTYMKQHNMATNNQFSPMDIMTMSNFNNVRKTMLNVLNGKVKDKLNELGIGTCTLAAMMTQLKNHDRYVFYRGYGAGITFFVGFWMNSRNSVMDYPEIKFVIELDKNSKKRKEIIPALRKIADDNPKRWYQYNLDTDVKNWSGITIHSSIQNFLHKEDHVAEMESFLIKALEDFEKVKPRLEPFMK